MASECIGGRHADGDEALPGAARGRGAVPHRLQQAGRQMQHGLGRCRPNVGLKQRRVVRDQWDGALIFAHRQAGPGVQHWQQIARGEVLGGQHAVQRLQ